MPSWPSFISLRLSYEVNVPMGVGGRKKSTNRRNGRFRSILFCSCVFFCTICTNKLDLTWTKGTCFKKCTSTFCLCHMNIFENFFLLLSQVHFWYKSLLLLSFLRLVRFFSPPLFLGEPLSRQAARQWDDLVKGPPQFWQQLCLCGFVAMLTLCTSHFHGFPVVNLFLHGAAATDCTVIRECCVCGGAGMEGGWGGGRQDGPCMECVVEKSTGVLPFW